MGVLHECVMVMMTAMVLALSGGGVSVGDKLCERDTITQSLSLYRF